MLRCGTFWGSHGCDLDEGHDPEQEHPVHECAVEEYDEDGEVIDRGVCSQAQFVREGVIRQRFLRQDGSWDIWFENDLSLFRNDERRVK